MKDLKFKALYHSSTVEILITKCTASSERYEQGCCEKAFNGDEGQGDAWRTFGPGYNNGAWIKLYLDGVYRLTKVMAMSRRKEQHFKDIWLYFLYGDRVGFRLADKDGWQNIGLEGIGYDIITNYVHISVRSLYHNHQDGFAEIKVFGNVAGISNNDNVATNYRLMFFFGRYVM